MADLKPCPFCGSNSLRFHYGQILCKNCGVEGPPALGPVTDEAVAEAWNRRAVDGVLGSAKTSDGTSKEGGA
jgi:Lar family restriction alleviation protein